MQKRSGVLQERGHYNDTPHASYLSQRTHVT